MKFEFFIAKRIIRSNSYKSSVSSPIIKIGIIAVALSIVVMLISIATGIGLQNEIRNKIVAFNGHINVSNFDNNNSQESLSPLEVNDTIINTINEIEEVTHLNKIAYKFGILRTEEDFDGVFFKGVDHQYSTHFINKYVIDGRFININDTISNEVVISKKISNKLKLNIGDSFQMLFSKDMNSRAAIRKFNIVGLFRSGFDEIDNSLLFGDIKHIQLINKWKSNEVGLIEVFVDNHKNLKNINEIIYQKTPSNYNSINIESKYSSIFDWIKIFDNNILAIISIMIIISSINIITTLLVLILERTNMIGVLKSFGANNSHIRKIFLIVVSYLILIGLIAGNGIGLLLLYIQEEFDIIKLNPEIYYVDSVPVYLNLEYILLLNLFTFLLCFLSTIIPSYVISRITPIKSIKFQ